MSAFPNPRHILGAAALLLATHANADHIKVFLLGGQSNMVGNNCLTSELPVALQAPQADVLFYPGSLTTLRPGFGGQFGPEITFGRTIADDNPAETYCLIKYAVNGSSLLGNWNPATGNSYASFRTRVENGIAALTAAGHTYEIEGMLWTQGEAEAAAGTTTQVYQAALNEFIADIRTRYGPNLPFFVSRLSNSQTNINANGLSTIRAAQEYVALNDPYTYLVDTDGMSVGTDNLHFDEPGQMAVGQAFGQSYIGSVVPDVTPPGIALLSPANGFAEHPATNNLVINFSEPVVFGTGFITVRKADGTVIETFDVANPPANLSSNLSGATLTIDLSSNLSYSTGYYVEIDAAAIDDNSGNSFAGFSGPSAWSFTTAAGQVGGLIDGSGITVTVSSLNGDGSNYPPQTVVNGTGLNGSGEHAAGGKSEWVSNIGATIVNGFISFDLGGTYVLDSMHVWNCTQYVNYGIKQLDIYVSDVFSPGDPEGAGAANWTKISDNVTFAAAGTPNVGFDLETQTGISLPTTAVRHVRFEIDTNQADATTGYVGLAEVQFIAAPSGPDTTEPTVSSLNPANGASGVPTTASPRATFNEPVAFGTGFITIRQTAGGAAVASYDVASPPANLILSGTTLTINPTADLAASTGYYVEIDATAIDDLAGNSFAGISGSTTWSFTTNAPDTTQPTITGLNPANGASGVPTTASPAVTFSEAVAFGTGFITIRQTAGGAAVASYDVASPPANLILSGSTLTINPTADLAASTGYYVEIDATAIDDLAGNSFAGISGSATWSFTTYAPETTPPTVSGLNPANGTSGVPTTASPVATFSEAVAFGTGFIRIRKTSGGTLVESYDVASPPANLTLSGTNLTINPSATLAASTSYYVEIDASAIDDLAGNSFAGISGGATWSFTTAAGQAGGLILQPSAITGSSQASAAYNASFSRDKSGFLSGTYTSGVDDFATTLATLQHKNGNGGSEGGTSIGWASSFNPGLNIDPKAAGNPGVIVIDMGSTVSVSRLGIWMYLNGNPVNAGVAFDSTKDFEVFSSDSATLASATLTSLGVFTLPDLNNARTGLAFDITDATSQYFVINVRSLHDDTNPNGNNHASFGEIAFEAANTNPGNDFSNWISGFNVGGQTGINDDFDNDGLPNAVENLMGTSPEVFNPGLTSVSASGGNLVFRHTLSSTPVEDLTGSYEWSANLADWNASGAEAAGTTVTFGTPAVITPGTPDLVEVTASISGNPAARIFARYKAIQN